MDWNTLNNQAKGTKTTKQSAQTGTSWGVLNEKAKKEYRVPETFKVEEEKPEDVGLLKRVGTFIGETYRGAKEAFPAGILQSAASLEAAFGVGLDKLGRSKPAVGGGKTKEIKLFTEAGEYLKNKAKQDLEGAEIYAKVNLPVEDGKTFLQNVRDPQWLGRGFGLNAPNLLTSLGISTAVLAITKNPVAATAAGFGTSFSMEGGAAYNDAKQAGLDDNRAEKIMGLVGVANGLLDTLPIGNLINRTAQGKEIKKKILKEITKGFIVQTGLESSTESVQEIIANAVAKTYDKDRKLFAGVAESAFFGGIMGGVTGLVGDIGAVSFSNRQEGQPEVKDVAPERIEFNMETGDVVTPVTEKPKEENLSGLSLEELKQKARTEFGGKPIDEMKPMLDEITKRETDVQKQPDEQLITRKKEIFKVDPDLEKFEDEINTINTELEKRGLIDLNKLEEENKDLIPTGKEAIEPFSQEAKRYKTAEEFASAVKEKANIVFKLAGNEIEDISVVGSTARGKIKPNDLDILVTPKKLEELTPSNLKTRNETSRLLEKGLKEFFPNKKVQVVISKYDIKRGPKVKLTDIWNKAQETTQPQSIKQIAEETGIKEPNIQQKIVVETNEDMQPTFILQTIRSGKVISRSSFSTRAEAENEMTLPESKASIIKPKVAEATNEAMAIDSAKNPDGEIVINGLGSMLKLSKKELGALLTADDSDILDPSEVLFKKVSSPTKGFDLKAIDMKRESLLKGEEQGVVTDTFSLLADKEASKKVYDKFYAKYQYVDREKVKETPGEFPDWKAIIPKGNLKKVFFQGYITRPIFGKMRGIYGVLSDGDNQVIVDIDRLAFMKDALPKAEIFFKEEGTPVVFKQGDKVVGLLMPMKGEDLTPDFKAEVKNPEPAEKTKARVEPKGTHVKTPSGNAMAIFKNEDEPNYPIKMGSLDNTKAIEFPELVDLARDLMGDVPSVVKKSGNAAGRFYGEGMGKIKLVTALFEKNNLAQASKVLAHEIGHLVDYLPDHFMKRGNIIGRLKTMSSFMKEYFGSEGALDTKTLRNQALKEILKENGIKMGDYMVVKSVREKLTPLVKERYNQKITESGGIKNSEIRKELLAVTRYWHPYDPATVPSSYKRYRESSKELYAEAISVLLNSPGLLEEMAPTFYSEFFKGLDAKPEVKTAYFGLQELLSRDRNDLIKVRREGVRNMFKEGDMKAEDIQRKRIEERNKRAKDIMFRLRFDLVDRNSRIIDKVAEIEKAGGHVNPDDNPVYYLEERNYIGGKIKAIMERDFNPIYQKLHDNDISWTDFGEILFYQRIVAGDRSDVANPRGITPKAAEELINKIKEEYGDKKFEILDKATKDFRTGLKKVAEDTYKSGLYTPELYARMQENPAYVTFQVLEHMEESLGSKVYKSIGTLKDISNPADASLMKMIATIKSTEQQITKKKVIEFLQKNHPSEIKEARTRFTGKTKEPIPSRLKNEELVIYYQEGKIKGVYVDPYISRSIERDSVGANNAIVGTLRFFNSGLFRPLFITFNLGFQSFNLVRDFFRFYKNVPDMTIYRALKRYKQATAVSKVRAFGLPKNPSKADLDAQKIINNLEYDKVFSVTLNDVLSGEQVEDRQIDRIMKESGIDSFRPEEGSRYLKVPKAVLEFIKNTGDLIETLPKAAGYFEFTELNSGKPLDKSQQSYIRKNIGSPDFLAGGFLKPATNEIFLFSNAITQAIRSDYTVATQPKTRSAFWWKTTKISFLPKIIMLSALAGLFGEPLEKMFEDVSEYDMTNYTIVPLGRDQKTGKTIYLRVPVDETTRFLGGMFWKMLTVFSNRQDVAKDITDIVSYTGGQLPSISPVIESFGATLQFISGQNPYDSFRGRQVLSDQVYKAGGWDATKAFLGWQFQQLGGGVFYRFYHEPTAPKEAGTVEKVFNLPIVSNIAGRYIRVSDYGQQEKLRQVQKQVEQKEAKEQLRQKNLLNEAIKSVQQGTSRDKAEEELLKAISAEKELDKAARKRIIKKLRTGIVRGSADPAVVSLIDADSNAQKTEILKGLKQAMSQKEFEDLESFVVAEKIVSNDVFFKLND